MTATTAAQLIGRSRDGWLAAFWTAGAEIRYRVIAVPERDFEPGLLITYGQTVAFQAAYAKHGGDIGETLAASARYRHFEPVTAYPLHAFCDRCGRPVSLHEGGTGWQHDEPGAGGIMPYRDPQPLPEEIRMCPSGPRVAQGGPIGTGEASS
jgi:hypothetical protein